MDTAILSFHARRGADIFERLPASRQEAPSAAVAVPAAMAAPAASTGTATTPVVIISPAVLIRDCLARCFAKSDLNCATSGHGTVEEWQPANPADAVTVLLCATGDRAVERAICDDIAKLQAKAVNSQIIVMSDSDDAALVRRTLEQGVQGFVSMSFNLDMAVAAIRLVQAGERFVPVTSLLTSHAAPAPASDRGPLGEALTQRQLDVIDRLRRGESNKIIAYKLDMSESTVKIHIRNIMRKIKARNRTEVAILTKDLFN